MAAGFQHLPLLGQEQTSSSIVSPRLFRATGRRVTPRVEWVEIQVKSVLNRVQGMPFDWSINPYRGCMFACRYCFARVTHWYLDQDGVNDWSARIFVKVNAPEILRHELARPSWGRERVSIGTATDPYQHAEGAYRITRQILEALRDFDTPVAIVTKSTMIVRDLDVLKVLTHGAGASVYFSITTMDPTLAREIEPNAPPPRRRLEALRALVRAGVPSGVLLAPVLPGITDDEDHLAAVVRAAKEHGARSLSTSVLHLGDVTRQAYFEYLEHKHPELVAAYERLYHGKHAPRAYQRQVGEVVAALKARLAFAPPRPIADRCPTPRQAPPREPAQLRLF